MNILRIPQSQSLKMNVSIPLRGNSHVAIVSDMFSSQSSMKIMKIPSLFLLFIPTLSFFSLQHHVQPIALTWDFPCSFHMWLRQNLVQRWEICVQVVKVESLHSLKIEWKNANGISGKRRKKGSNRLNMTYEFEIQYEVTHREKFLCLETS